MSAGMKFWWTGAILLAVVLNLQEVTDGAPQVPCYFIFGDSLADNGNNNFLQTLAKVDYSPYGIDFPAAPRGRFCNGRTVVDVIAELLGFDRYVSPFATANGLEILHGVNYASGSSGILDESGGAMGEHVSLNRQLENHQTTISRMANVLGSSESTSRFLRGCLYSLGMGNNDYLNNYFQPLYYPSSQQYTLEEFTQLLIDNYKQQIKTLYGYGARKTVLFGLGKIGCTPGIVSSAGTNRSDCVEIVNNAARLFNSKLLSVVDQLNRELSDAKFIYINNYKIGEDAHALDFRVKTKPCCQASSTGQCIPNEIPCQDRAKYMFWDFYHPTEAFNIFYANRSFRASDPKDSYPFDIHHLVLLDQGGAAAS